MEFDRTLIEKMALPGGKNLGEEDVLVFCAGCRWVEQCTQFRFEAGEPPPEVKLFLLKYREIIESGAMFGVETERLAGMSQAGMTQTFASGVGVEDLVRQAAAQLLARWYRPVAVVAAQRRFG